MPRLNQVLAEINDIIDLPHRAEMVLEMLADPANTLPAFEALTVMEGTAENAKAAWRRWELADTCFTCAIVPHNAEVSRQGPSMILQVPCCGAWSACLRLCFDFPCPCLLRSLAGTSRQAPSTT